LQSQDRMCLAVEHHPQGAHGHRGHDPVPRSCPRPRRVAEVLEMIDMPSDARTRIGALSEGQCRRVDLGVAVVGRPEVLFLDDRPRAWIQKPAGGCGQGSRTWPKT
jgi:ABC-type branched-subunit amino acid transport system ATPase component